MSETAAQAETPLLSLRKVGKTFVTQRSWLGRPTASLRAVDGVDLDVARGETVGLVGESGCGKSTLGRMAIRLLDPSEGQVSFDGHDVTALGSAALRPYRRRMQIVFQDPMSALNPRLTVREAIGEPLRIHGLAKTRDEEASQVEALLAKVGLRKEHASRYPHEFSGGQRQRIVIARALSVRPELVVCDEPVAALDVSIQAQVVNLLRDLQDELGLAYLFVAHDLSVVRFMSRRVAVMYLGRIVELAASDALYESPKHPYTQALLSAIPVPDPKAHKKRLVLAGEPPSPTRPPPGCTFHPRCPIAKKGLCDVEAPVLREVGASRVACHLAS
ncbi:MAG: oligopeptide/dipeptide ABC transporter ATP-binding protein [Sandaracinus sp.]